MSMNNKTIRANLAAVLFALSVALSTGCGQKEIAALKTERDGLQAKLLAMENGRDKLTGEYSLIESEMAKASNGFQAAITGMSNAFQLERAGLLLTNGFLSGQVEQLKADLDTQHKRSLADQSRENDTKIIAPIKEGLRALRKLDSAANIGTSIGDYNRLLIDSQGPIREAIEASEPEIKLFIGKAGKAFQDAKTLWNFCNEQIASIGGNREFIGDLVIVRKEETEIALLISDYDIPREKQPDGKSIHIKRGIALTMIWVTSKFYLQQAEKLFSAQVEKRTSSKAD